MKCFAALIVLLVLVASVLSQAPMNPMPGAPMQQQAGQGQPDIWKMMLYHNYLDMNWLHAILFSNGFGGMGGGQGGGMGSALPWLLFGNM